MRYKEVLERLERRFEIEKLNLLLEKEKQRELEKERMKLFLERLFSKGQVLVKKR
ncbi:hypothetical protein [Persephonella sp. KM09-Lau-8]|uniref:hypothetical protein n=1 Tax=Persephonella sp. KM09-Lau-8 TaxID=1158345 RepID=UPI0012DE1A8E|nr:hypothetical protein [Persephonella sp. KM09-Lau-8]